MLGGLFSVNGVVVAGLTGSGFRAIVWVGSGAT